MFRKSFVLSCILFGISQFSFANITPETSMTIREEITKSLQNFDFRSIDDQAKLVIKFIISDDGKLFILGSSNKQLQGRIENHLNFMKFKADDVVRNQIYTLPITLKKV